MTRCNTPKTGGGRANSRRRCPAKCRGSRACRVEATKHLMLKHLNSSFPELQLSKDFIALRPENRRNIPYVWRFKDGAAGYKLPVRRYKDSYNLHRGKGLGDFSSTDHRNLAKALKEGKMWAVLKEVRATPRRCMSPSESADIEDSDFEEGTGSTRQSGVIEEDLLEEMRDLDFNEIKELLTAQIRNNTALEERIAELEAAPIQSATTTTKTNITSNLAFSFHQQYNFDCLDKAPLVVRGELSNNRKKVILVIQSGDNEKRVTLKLGSRSSVPGLVSRNP